MHGATVKEFSNSVKFSEEICVCRNWWNIQQVGCCGVDRSSTREIGMGVANNVVLTPQITGQCGLAGERVILLATPAQSSPVSEQYLALLTCIREVPRSNIDLNTKYPD
jgi:hypothetical protein